jgi:hypothetical protein
MADISYVPGALTAVAGDRCLALLEATPDSPAVAWIRQRLEQGAPTEVLLARFLGAGLDGMGGFVLLAESTAGQRRLFCRGTVAATVVSGGEAGGSVSTRIDGMGLLTWQEHLVAPDTELIVLGEPPADGAPRLPAPAGLLRAGCVIIDLTESASSETVRYDLRVGASAGHPGSDPDAGSAVTAHPDTLAAVRVTGHSDTITVTSSASVPGTAASSADIFQAAPAVAPAEDAAAPAEDAAAPAEDSGSALVPLEPVPVRPGSPGRLIDAVPWGPGPGAVAPPSPHRTSITPAMLIDSLPPTAGPSESGFTVRHANLPAPGEAGRAARTAPPPDRIGPAVSALICPAGHVNPPSEAVCRQCGAPLPNDAVVVPRPVLGMLRLSTGDVIALDRSVVMGRSPRADRAGADGEERPHVVKLPSADGDISRTHLRVTINGWHVLVTDLDSTNGTLVTLPGRDPEQLRPHEPVPIRPGTVVTLADGIDFRFEACE